MTRPTSRRIARERRGGGGSAAQGQPSAAAGRGQAPDAAAEPVVLAVRVRPRASRPGVGGEYAGPNGPALVVAVREPAVEGRATRAVLDAVADALGVPRSQVLLRTGERGRDKLLTIVDPPADLDDRVRTLRGADSRASDPPRDGRA